MFLYFLFFFFFFFFFFNDTATTEIYTLSLHDALPITAADVVWTWELWAAPWIHGPASAQSKVWGLAGAKEFNDGTADKIAGVQVVDDHTITAKLDPPNALWTIGQQMD